MNTASNSIKFQLGRLVATPSVLGQVPRSELFAAVRRHQCGDWGDVDMCDKRENDAALHNGGRILSMYHSAEKTKFWVITEADRSYTTVLLPEEY